MALSQKHIAMSIAFSTQGDYLEKAVNIANKEDLDWFVSIHFNATTTHTGQGVEA